MTEASDVRRRGPDTEDPRAFSQAKLPSLARAAEEVSWLLGRGYPMDLAVRCAGDHHQLHARARLALTRACTAPERAIERERKRLVGAAIVGETVSIDAFNVLVTMEVARGGGPLFRCVDGAIRDLAGLRGSYKCVSDTEPAIARLAQWLLDCGAACARVYVDEPVSNSGRVRALFEQCFSKASEGREFAFDVRMVRDADTALDGAAVVLSADAVVIDRAERWVSVVSELLDEWAPDAWVIDLKSGTA
ncbi:MAG: DUF434 domain-containing protein [Polyangiales bacterium]